MNFPLFRAAIVGGLLTALANGRIDLNRAKQLVVGQSSPFVQMVQAMEKLDLKQIRALVK